METKTAKAARQRRPTKRLSMPGMAVTLAASLALAGLAASCYNPGSGVARVTSIHLDRTEFVLSMAYPYLGTAEFTLTLRPSTAWEGVVIDWFSTSGDGNARFIETAVDNEFDSNGRATAKLMVEPTVNLDHGPYTFYIRARAESADGDVFYAWCKIVVVDHL